MCTVKVKPKIISLIIVLFLIVFMMCASGCENKEEKEYNDAITELNDAKDNLNKKIYEAESLLNSTSPTSVANTSTLEDLRKETENAKSLYNDIKVPDDKPDSKDYNAETEKMEVSLTYINTEIETLNKTISNVNNSKDSKSKEGANLKERYDVIMSDNKGYKIHEKILTTDYIKTSNQTLLDVAWKNAGGKDSIPAVDSLGKKFSNNFKKENCIAVIGKIEIENASPDFPINNFDVDVEASFSYRSKGYRTGTIDANTQIQNWIYYTSSSNNGKSDYASIEQEKTILSTKLTSNSLVAPFVIYLENAFNPKYPSGVPDLDDLNLRFYNGLGSTSQKNIDGWFMPSKAV